MKNVKKYWSFREKILSFFKYPFAIVVNGFSQQINILILLYLSELYNSSFFLHSSPNFYLWFFNKNRFFCTSLGGINSINFLFFRNSYELNLFIHFYYANIYSYLYVSTNLLFLGIIHKNLFISIENFYNLCTSTPLYERKLKKFKLKLYNSLLEIQLINIKKNYIILIFLLQLLK